MTCSSIRFAPGIVLLLAAGPATLRAANTYTEDFTTTTYKDAAATTADWNIAAGELRLFPFTPGILGTADTPGSAVGVAVDGDHAFVADESGGLRVVDISDPASPAVIGNYAAAGNVYDAFVDGDRVFLAAEAAGLLVLDISNPGSPALLGTYDTPGLSYGIAVSGAHAYVADYFGLVVVDISNPSTPTLAGGCTTPGFPRGVFVSGDLAFVADWTGGLTVVNISDPTNPVVVGNVATPSVATSVFVSGDHAYVTAQSTGLLVVDVSNPTTPTIVGSTTAPAYARDVVVDGDHAYVADTSVGLYSIDITDSTNPVSRWSVATPSGGWGVALSGTRAVVAGAASGAEVIAVSTLTQPGLLSASAYDMNNVTVDGDFAYVTGLTGGFRVLDVSDPTSTAALLGTYTASDADYVQVVVEGDHAFVSSAAGQISMGGPSRVYAFDVSVPNNPNPIGSYDIPLSTAYPHLDVAGDFAYVTDGAVGLLVLDITDPTSLSAVGSVALSGEPGEVVVQGSLVFIAAGPAGLLVVDVSDPTTPIQVGSYPTTYDALQLAVSGNLALVGTRESVESLDVTDPTLPAFLGTFNSGDTSDLVISGDEAYVGSPYLGFFVLDIADPTAPSVKSGFVPGFYSLNVVGDYVFAAYTFAPSVSYGPYVFSIRQDEVIGVQNAGRSLRIDGGGESAVCGKVTAIDTPGITWYLTADGGATLTPTPVGAWTVLIPGNDLRWQTWHLWTPGNNPTASDLQVDWRTESGTLLSVEDVPDDQGGWVRLRFLRSGYDFDVASTPLLQYFVQRQFDDAGAVVAGGSPADRKGALVPEGFRSWPETLPLLEYQGQFFTLESAPGQAPATIAWEIVGSAPAIQQDVQIVTVPTLGDSTSGASPDVFRLLAQSTSPGAYYTSDPMSGFSLDNIAPGVPSGLTVGYDGGGNQLAWDPSPAEDFQYFRIYRDTDPGFVPSPANLAHSTASTSWTDPDYNGWAVTYKVTALDYVGNESGPASAGATTGAEAPVVPTKAALYQSRPNPTGAVTRIGYDVPAPGAEVHLVIYDIAGRRVRTLVAGHEAPGQRTATWRGRDDSGLRVPAGVYFYRITIGHFTQTRRMMVLG